MAGGDGVSALVWGIKASLLGYVRGISDGEVLVTDGADVDGGVFVFPEITPLRFRGAVTLLGHGGMMRVVLRDPAIELRDGAHVLTIADPDDSGVRLDFATIGAFDGERASGTALTADGADLFFGPYEAGTPLDDPEVRTTN